MPPRLLMTFDDRTVTSWFAHRGVLEDAGARATFFVSHADTLTDTETEQLRLLARDGHTIASHGARHRHGPRSLADHGLTAYLADEIAPSIAALAERGLGHRDFAYPFGAHEAALDDALTATFSWMRATTPRHEDPRALDVLVDLDDEHASRVLPARGVDVGRRGVVNPDDGDTLVAVLDHAARTGESVCLFAHEIAPWDRGLAEGRNFITPDRLREVLAAARERGLVADGLGALPD